MYSLCHPFEAQGSLSSQLPQKQHYSFSFCLELRFSFKIYQTAEKRGNNGSLSKWKALPRYACTPSGKPGCGPTHMKGTSYSTGKGRKEKKSRQMQQITVPEELFQVNRDLQWKYAPFIQVSSNELWNSQKFFISFPAEKKHWRIK